MHWCNAIKYTHTFFFVSFQSHGTSPRGAGRSPQPTSAERQELLSGRAAGANGGENIQLQDMSPSKPAWQKKVSVCILLSFINLYHCY